MKLELMLRIYFLQQWFNLGAPTVEEAVYDRISFQRFLRVDLMNDAIPDETTILNSFTDCETSDTRASPITPHLSVTSKRG